MRNIIITNKTNIKNYFSVIALSIALVSIAILSINNVRAQQQQEQGGILPAQSLLSEASIPRDLDVVTDYNKTQVYINKGTIDFNISLVNKEKDLEKLGLVLVIHKLESGKMVMYDQILATTTKIKIGESSISYSYNIPTNLTSGNYMSSFRVMSEGGLPVKMFLPIKDFEVKDDLTSIKNNLKPLDGARCQIKIKDLESGKIYGLLDGPDISTKESLELSCDTEGSLNSGEYDLYSSLSKRSLGVQDLIFDKDARIIKVENNKFSISINPVEVPQAYDYVFYLSKDNKRVTPVMQAHYVVQGESATVHKIDYNISSDMRVIASISGSATNFPESRAGVTSQKNNVIFYFLDADKNTLRKENKTVEISNQESIDVDENTRLSGLENLKFIKVEIVSSNGLLLFEKEIEVSDFKTSIANAKLDSKDNKMYLYTGIIVLVLFLLVIIYYVFYKNKLNKNIVNSFIFAILAISLLHVSAQSSNTIVAGSGESRSFYSSYSYGSLGSQLTDYGPYIVSGLNGRTTFTTWCGNFNGNQGIYLNIDVREKLNGVQVRSVVINNTGDAKIMNSYWSTWSPSYVYGSQLNTGSNTFDFDFKFYFIGNKPYQPRFCSNAIRSNCPEDEEVMPGLDTIHRYTIIKNTPPVPIVPPPTVNIKFR